MDISRLPVAPVGRPVSTPDRTARQATAVETPASVRPAGRREAGAGPVVQGELLARPRTLFQSTQSFLTERSLVRARPAGQPSDPPLRSRAAIGSYLGNSGVPSAAADRPPSSLSLVA